MANFSLSKATYFVAELDPISAFQIPLLQKYRDEMYRRGTTGLYRWPPSFQFVYK